MTDSLPIFALGTTLFPGGLLSLRIFEPRYLDMIKRCMAQGTPFGVCLIADGRETGTAPKVHTVGTLARITDFDLLDDGLLGITAKGEERFSITSTRVASDQLLSATTLAYTAEADVPVPDEFEHLAGVAQALLEHLKYDELLAEDRFERAAWVGHRLAESLPIDTTQRQSMLEMTDPVQRLAELAAVVAALIAKHPDE